MLSAQQMATLNAANCEVAFDNRTRQLYATDASPYQIVPAAVAFPKTSKAAARIIQAALVAGVSVTPRGAGTGLSGGAIGEGLIMDFARHNRQIWDFDKDLRTVRVGAGVVLDQLNSFLQPAGFCFGPDVATSSRATLGGMIANDSSGAHTPVYGTTGQHVREIEIIMADGKATRIGAHLESLHSQRHLVEDLVSLNSLQIAEQFPAGLLKRWPGYGLARALEQPGNLIPILCGSEGTLAGIFSAELNIVPLPEERGIGLIFFASVAEAMQATPELLDLKPAAIEHVDRPLFDQTRGQREFAAVRALLDLDAQPCAAILIVEFFAHAKDKLAQLQKRRLGRRQLILKNEGERNLVWAMRKAGLSLLTSRKGNAKPACFIEDAAVRPQDLPAYVASLEELMRRGGVEASFYGHAAAGLLHVRPVLDLHLANDLKKFRQIADEVAALVMQFKGSLAAEHGVGMARTEFLKAQVGAELYGVMREIKQAFDPNNLFNPGKIIGDGRYKIDENLRQGADRNLVLPFEPKLAFAARDESFTANLEQCNGCGGCIKLTPTMCPTYIATGEEGMSTRGRANLIRAALEHREIADPLRAEELEYALGNCLSCRACTNECPSNVNLPLLKAELLHARTKRDGLTVRQRMISSVDFLGRVGTSMPWLMNGFFASRSVRHVFGKLFGLTGERPMLAFAHKRFDRWFARHAHNTTGHRGRVILWDDTFVRYHEPHIGMAAVAVLEAAGFYVTLPTKRKCCGRPAFSVGHLAEAEKLGRHNLALLANDDAPVIFLEPSCYSMFAEDYRELKLPGAEQVAARCFLFEDFIGQLLEREPKALRFEPQNETLVIHAHCHARALMNPGFMQRLAARLPGRKATLLDTGCCGMAGSFGLLETKYELSLKIAEPLMEQLKHQPYGTTAIVSGTSCRYQVQHLAPIRTRHMAEVIADALK
ncbi:MAG TPA: FAD-linked oxidase C-terminal domain-containing protein [Candidatus Limnocylindrales bacterium]|nr:FAD-linked oxidase C-terminal domain-containing protein [Candidatus Limnocylindrales bacterium]